MDAESKAPKREREGADDAPAAKKPRFAPPAPLCVPCELFVDQKFAAEHKCPVCLCVPLDPHELPCGHMGCHSCLKQCLEATKNTCPTCRGACSFHQLRTTTFVKGRIVATDVKCVCGSIMTVRAWTEHLCAALTVQCDSCSQSVAKIDWNMHKLDTCSKRAVKCAHCGTSMAADALDAHVTAVGNLPCVGMATCPFGNEIIPKAELTKHIIKCQHQPMWCTVCEQRTTNGQFRKHVEDDVVTHLLVLMQKHKDVYLYHWCDRCENVASAGTCVDLQKDATEGKKTKCFFRCEECNGISDALVCVYCLNVCHAGHRHGKLDPEHINAWNKCACKCH